MIDQDSHISHQELLQALDGELSRRRTVAARPLQELPDSVRGRHGGSNRCLTAIPFT